MDFKSLSSPMSPLSEFSIWMSMIIGVGDVVECACTTGFDTIFRRTFVGRSINLYRKSDAMAKILPSLFFRCKVDNKLNVEITAKNRRSTASWNTSGFCRNIDENFVYPPTNCTRSSSSARRNGQIFSVETWKFHRNSDEIQN